MREKMENGFSSEGENDDRGENRTSETDGSEGQRSHLLRVNVRESDGPTSRGPPLSLPVSH